MNSKEYYEQKLYPLQNKVLQVVKSCDTNFYLTGGTALSRVFFQHRYSDDLDFFVNADEKFKYYVDKVERAFSVNFLENFWINVKDEGFVRMSIRANEVILKVDFVNDVPFRVGEPLLVNNFGKVDNLLNILSNKITALPRQEPKDIADIIEIATNCKFNWREVISYAKKKDSWVDEADVIAIIASFDISSLQEVKWIKPFHIGKLKEKLEVLLDNLLFGSDNQLYS